MCRGQFSPDCGLSVYQMVGKRWKLIRRVKAVTVDFMNDLPKAALDMLRMNNVNRATFDAVADSPEAMLTGLWLDFGIRPPA
jgi:hypothetical protein